MKKMKYVPVDGTDEELRDAIISTFVSVRDELKTSLLDLADGLEKKGFYLFSTNVKSQQYEYGVYELNQISMQLRSRSGRKRARELSKNSGGLVRNNNWPKHLTPESRFAIQYGLNRPRRRLVFTGTLEACQLFARELKQV